MNVVTPVQTPEAVSTSIPAPKARKLGPFKWDDALLLDGAAYRGRARDAGTPRTTTARTGFSPACSKPTGMSGSTARS